MKDKLKILRICAVVIVLICFSLQIMKETEENVTEEMAVGRAVTAEPDMVKAAIEDNMVKTAAEELFATQHADTDDTVIYTLPENAICHYEARMSTPYDGYMISIYEETPGKDIVFDGVLLVEEASGDIYMLGEEDWIPVKVDGDVLADINLQDEPRAVLRDGEDSVWPDEETVNKVMDEAFDFLKREERLENFKIIYDGVCMFLDRTYYRVSSYEETDIKIRRVQTYYINTENSDFYKESDHITTGTRMELYYLGN